MKKENVPPPLYGYPKPHWRISEEERARAEADGQPYIDMDCPWCGQPTTASAHSEPIGLAKRYGPRGAYSGDSTCRNCGRGIFFWGMPWVYRMEYDEDGSSDTFFGWDDVDRQGSSLRTGMAASGRVERESLRPLRIWSRSDPDAPTVYTKVADPPPHPCSLGNHQRIWGATGWSDIEGALVNFTCGRCNASVGWGFWDEGPAKADKPAPPLWLQDEWARLGRAKMEREEREREERAAAAPDVEGQCNARWATNRCTRPAGHEGDHGIIARGGLIIAPWPQEEESHAAGDV